MGNKQNNDSSDKMSSRFGPGAHGKILYVRKDTTINFRDGHTGKNDAT